MGLLLFVGMLVKGTVYTGYAIAGTYFVKTGVRYVNDYREAISKERG